MANVDAVCIAGAPSMHHIAKSVETMLGVPVALLEDGSPYLLVGDRSQVTIYQDADHPERWFAEIYHGGDVADRQALAHRIYDYLVAHTDWDLICESDDADDIVASRVTARTT